MNKAELKKQIAELATGRNKKYALMLFDYNCPEGTYRYGEHREKIMTVAELEKVRNDYELVIIYKVPKNDKPTKS